MKHFNMAVAGVAKRLSDVYGDGVGVVNPVNDIPYRQLWLQAETADIKVGSSAVTTSVYGTNLVSTAPAAPMVLGPFESGPIKLSDIYVISTTATLHISGIPF
jgi:hypothetical protein